MTLTLLRYFIITISLVFLSLNFVQGQNCKAQIIKQLQGTWIKEGYRDTALVIINGEKLELNFKGSRYWEYPYKN